MADTTHVVLFSGGLGSWATAKRVADKHGTDNLILLFCDTRIEDPDLYRFLPEAAANVGGRLVILNEGRTVWEGFRDVKFLGNARIDPCSRILKRAAGAAPAGTRSGAEPIFRPPALYGTAAGGPASAASTSTSYVFPSIVIFSFMALPSVVARIISYTAPGPEGAPSRLC